MCLHLLYFTEFWPTINVCTFYAITIQSHKSLKSLLKTKQEQNEIGEAQQTTHKSYVQCAIQREHDMQNLLSPVLGYFQAEHGVGIDAN